MFNFILSKNTKRLIFCICLFIISISSYSQAGTKNLFAYDENSKPRWSSPENLNGVKGAGEKKKMGQKAGLHVLLKQGKHWYCSILKPGDYQPDLDNHHDICATAYFYLNRPSNELPSLQPFKIGLHNLKQPKITVEILFN